MGALTHRRYLSARSHSLDGRVLYEEFLRCTGRIVGLGLEFGIDSHVDGYHQGVSYPPFGRTRLIFSQITVGRPRPDLFGRCEPPQDYTSNPVHGLTSWRLVSSGSLRCGCRDRLAHTLLATWKAISEEDLENGPFRCTTELAALHPAC
jgi:hypothetical protein